MFWSDLFKSTFNKLKYCHCVWFCTLLLHFSTCAFLFLPDEKSCYLLLTRNNCSKFLASYGVIFQSNIQLYTLLLLWILQEAFKCVPFFDLKKIAFGTHCSCFFDSIHMYYHKSELIYSECYVIFEQFLLYGYQLAIVYFLHYNQNSLGEYLSQKLQLH